MTPQRLFAGPKLKIDRAKQHISNLESMSLAFSQNSYRITVNPDAESGNDFLELSIIEPFPEHFSTIVGDVLHNLKSALDHAVNVVTIARLGKADDYSRFPVRKTAKELAAAIHGAEITKASRAVADFIRDVVKPYEGGNDAIWTLHRLNILDKHRLLIPVWQFTGINGIRAENDEQVYAMGSWFLTRRGPYRQDLPGTNFKITNYGIATLTVLFQEGMPVRNETVIPTLHQLTELVSGVVEGIESTFLAEDR